jgi:amidohydrolase
MTRPSRSLELSSRTLLAAASFLLTTPAVADPLSDQVKADMPGLMALYRELHAHPELSQQEKATAARIASEVKALGFTVTTGVGGTGVVAVMKNGAGPVLLIRTDLDGLPVEEATGLPYASKVKALTREGAETRVMHACGHDMHMTSWVGTARRLASMKDRWSGTLVLIAQPAEEIGKGAQAMLTDGLYTRFPKPQYVLALHDWSGLPAGTVGYTPGYTAANVDSVDILVKGVGGHGAVPHSTRDPIVLASRIVMALQTLVSREVDPQDAAVVTVGSFHAGTKHNIIPDEARLQLTVRSYSEATRRLLLDGIARIARGEAIAAGLPEDRMPVVSTKEDEATPAVLNTEPLTGRLVDIFTRRFGPERVVKLPATMGGEDFSRYLLADKSIQSTLFWVGGVPRAKWEEAGGNTAKLPSIHSPFWAPDPEPTLQAGIEAMTTAALDVLARK